MLGEGHETVFSSIFLAVILLLMVYTLAGNYFQHIHFHKLHETGLGILIGVAVGAIIHFVEPDALEGFSQKIFFYGLLPQIIFEGGYNLKKSRLFQNFNYISIYGLLGTLVSFFVVMGLTILINNWGWIRKFSNINIVIYLSIKNILLYSATICATDSVAALTMIKPDKYPKLFSIVFGEGMVNDAVAIILFRAVADMFKTSEHGESDLHLAEIITIIENFVINLVCSLLIGIFSGLLCTFLFKNLRKLTEKHDIFVLEIVISYLFGILSYGASQLLEFSGVISVLVCGITMAHFNFYNLSENGQLLTGVSFKAISFGAQSFLFVYLGLASWKYFTGNYVWSWTFITIQLIICAIARFACIFGLSGLFYIFMRKKWDVNVYELAIVWFAGIIRGSVAFALILTIAATPGDEADRIEVEIIKGTVLIMVFLTTIILGGLMPSFVTLCLSQAQKMENKRIEKKKSSTILAPEESPLEEQPIIKPPKEKGCLKKFWGNLDQRYFKPALIYKYEERKEEIKQAKKKMKMNSEKFKGAQLNKSLMTSVQNTSDVIMVQP